MVLVLAALYTIYQSRKRQQEQFEKLELQQAYEKQHQKSSMIVAAAIMQQEQYELDIDRGSRAAHTHNEPSPDEMSCFRDDVRQEWMDAVFGNENVFDDVENSNINHTGSKRTFSGVGRAGISSWLAYRSTIPSSESSNKSNSILHEILDDGNDIEVFSAHGSAESRLGLTLGRLSLGLYVMSVDPSSEAFFLGIPVGAVLVSINHMAFLAEPSRNALERLWQYEGTFAHSRVNATINSRANFLYDPELNMQKPKEKKSQHSANSVQLSPQQNASKHQSSPASLKSAFIQPPSRVMVPMALTYIFKGQLRTVLFLGGSPWGMTWAPCVNVPVVKRAYSHCAQAGVRKGSLLACVNGLSFRQADHTIFASKLRQLFDSGQEISLTLCFTPAAARTSHYAKAAKQAENPSAATEPSLSLPNTQLVSHNSSSASSKFQHITMNGRCQSKQCFTTHSHDGVQIKFHPFGQALSSFCSTNVFLPLGIRQQPHANMVHKESNCTANRNRQHQNLGITEGWAYKVAAGHVPALTLWKQQLHERACHGENLDMLSPKKVYGKCPELSPQELLDVWDPLHALVESLSFCAAGYRLDSSTSDACFAQLHSISVHDNDDKLIQVLKDITSRHDACIRVSSFLLQFLALACAPNGRLQKGRISTSNAPINMSAATEESLAHVITAMLLKVSRKDQGFCQRLYFLLRSFISAMGTPQHDNNGSRNLVALMNCLESLRFAEKEAVTFSTTSLHDEIAPTFSEFKHAQREMPISASTVNDTGDHDMACLWEQLDNERKLSTSSKMNPSTATQNIGAESSLSHVKTEKRRTFFGRFRKKIVGKSGNDSFTMMPTPHSYVAPSAQSVHSDSLQFTVNSNNIKSNDMSYLDHKTQMINGSLTHPSREGPAFTKSSNARAQIQPLIQSPSVMYDNMSDFLCELDVICGTIERSLQKSFREKMTDWAMQPWSPSKDTALADVTALMRQHMAEINAAKRMLLVNPVDSSELFTLVDCDECYILPSAHFPILLTFDVSERRCSDQVEGEECFYRTKAELISLKGGSDLENEQSFTVHAAVAGCIIESGPSQSVVAVPGSNMHVWQDNGTLIFDTRSSWGSPQTLSLRLSSTSKCSQNSNELEVMKEVGFAWVDLSHQFQKSTDETSKIYVTELQSAQSGEIFFDDHGDLPADLRSESKRVELKLKITTESVPFDDSSGLCRKRMLLYKHNDDLRQEAFAMQFIRTCDDLLKASGLDLKLLTFQCIPVETKRGFVEWVPGSVPLSEICQPFAGSILGNEGRANTCSTELMPFMLEKSGLTKYESLRRLGGQQNVSLRRLRGTFGKRGSFANNPIQDYLRNIAYDPHAPFLVRREVMDSYVKSCAGYSVITYILGVGDRHLDNLLLHQSGSLFHCDYSFILGSDPKTYLPVRVTEDMIFGMGGTDSDNYARFLSIAGAAYLSLRRPESVRILLSMLRLMEYSNIPDISVKQTIDEAITGVRDRLRLDLTESEAVAHIEGLVESSQSLKLWIAVDAIHSLGKRF